MGCCTRNSCCCCIPTGAGFLVAAVFGFECATAACLSALFPAGFAALLNPPVGFARASMTYDVYESRETKKHF